MKRGLVAILLVFTTVAYAGPHNVMVLKAEGTADAGSRAAIEPHILRLAKHIDGKIDAGDITLTDAAAAAGCAVADASCKDEILATFAVDEIVTTTVTPAPMGQVTVTVRRLTKGSAPRAAATTVQAAKAGEKIDQDIGPLFGAGLSVGPLVDKGTNPTIPTQPKEPTTAVTTQPTRPPVAPVEGPFPNGTEEPAAPTAPIDPSAGMKAAPEQPGQTDAPMPSRKWQKIGIGVGASLVLLSFVMWTQASTKQEAIDNAPHDSPADFKHLRDLEHDADGLAGGGNLFFVAGVVLGGISGYYYWKKGRTHRTQTARISPAAFPHGAGVVLTFGGGL